MKQQAKTQNHSNILLHYVTVCCIAVPFEIICCTGIFYQQCVVEMCADAPAPSWEELESVMLAVKLVVHGLMEFIQNFSKKSHDTPQVHRRESHYFK